MISLSSNSDWRLKTGSIAYLLPVFLHLFSGSTGGYIFLHRKAGYHCQRINKSESSLQPVAGRRQGVNFVVPSIPLRQSWVLASIPLHRKTKEPSCSPGSYSRTLNHSHNEATYPSLPGTFTSQYCTSHHIRNLSVLAKWDVWLWEAWFVHSPDSLLFPFSFPNTQCYFLLSLPSKLLMPKCSSQGRPDLGATKPL